VNYTDFVSAKLGIVRRDGIVSDVSGYSLFPHQSDLTAWALRRGSVAIQMGRRFVGFELKDSYYRQAARNLSNALRDTADLFSCSATE